MKIIKFYTTWCGPCKVLSVILQQVDLSGVDFVEIDAAAGPDVIEAKLEILR